MQRIDLVFTPNNTNNEKDAWDTFTEVSIWDGNDRIARIDTSRQSVWRDENRNTGAATLRLSAKTARLIIAKIEAGHDILGAADEPHIIGAVGGAGLAGQRAAQGQQCRAGAALDHAFHHVQDLESSARIHHLFDAALRARHRPAVPFGRVAAGAAAIVAPPDHLAAAVLHIIDQAGFQLAALVKDLGIGVGELHHGGFARPQRNRQHRLIPTDAQRLCLRHDAIHAGGIGNAHRHQVARLFEAPAQSLWPGRAHIVEVLEAFRAQKLGLEHAIAAIHHDAGRGEAIVHRSGINDGLERRTRLAIGLGGAVEGLRAGIEAAHHGAHAARGHFLCHEPARNLRRLPQRPTGRRSGHGNHVTGAQHLRGRSVGAAIRPRGVAARQRATAAISEADHAVIALLGQHHRLGPLAIAQRHRRA